jgi:hypothetical protein
MFKQPAPVCGLIQLGVPQTIISYFAFARQFRSMEKFHGTALAVGCCEAIRQYSDAGG